MRAEIMCSVPVTTSEVLVGGRNINSKMASLFGGSGPFPGYYVQRWHRQPDNILLTGIFALLQHNRLTSYVLPGHYPASNTNGMDGDRYSHEIWPRATGAIVWQANYDRCASVTDVTRFFD